MPKSIPEGFKALIKKLQPVNTEHKKAQSHKGSVESCLKNNFNSYNFFETGSFGAGTGVRHYSDTDYFAVFPRENYFKNSNYCLTRVKDALKSTFTSTKGISVSCPAVSLPFGYYSSETLEVTPSYFNGMAETPLGKYPQYAIPDCNGSWMYSSPDAHNAYVKSQNNRLKDDKVKKLIQLVKAWKYFNSVPIISFYLELRVTKYVEGESSIVHYIDLKRFFKHLHTIGLADMRDPMRISGLISPSKTYPQKLLALSKLKTALTRAEKAEEAREKGNIDLAFAYWDLLFNGNFPTR